METLAPFRTDFIDQYPYKVKNVYPYKDLYSIFIQYGNVHKKLINWCTENIGPITHHDVYRMNVKGEQWAVSFVYRYTEYQGYLLVCGLTDISHYVRLSLEQSW